MNIRLFLGAAAAACTLFVAPAFADGGPIACTQAGATVPSYLAGAWQPRQRDDGYEWHDIAVHTFRADGTWVEVSQTGTEYGHWCVHGNALIWGFDRAPQTTYRVTLGGEPMRGFMSWDGGGTGEVEISRVR